MVGYSGSRTFLIQSRYRLIVNVACGAFHVEDTRQDGLCGFRGNLAM